MKLFQNSKGVFFASFTDQKGKRRYVSLKTGDRKVAEKIAEQIVPHELAKEREPIRREVDRYLEYHRELRSQNYDRDNTAVLRAWASEITELGSGCVQEIDTPKLQTWFYNKARLVKVATVAAYLFAVKHFLNWAKEERHLVLYNAADKVRVPKHTKAVRRNFLPLRDAERLIDSCVDPELRFALYCSIHAGFRYGEIVMARPEWFDVENRLIHIQASATWQPKNGKDRPIPMSDEFATLLEGYDMRGPFMISPEKLSAARHRYRFDFSRRFERLTMQLGLECTMHDLRRTFCSLKVSAGVPILKVAKWAGHRISVCEEHYSHLAPNDGQINVGLERRAPAPEVTAPEGPAHRQLTWEELKELVWSKPMTRAARDLGITDNGLRKMCTRMQVPVPPQGYWQCPPARREKFLERTYRSHKGADSQPEKVVPISSAA
jgi:integrase